MEAVTVESADATAAASSRLIGSIARFAASSRGLLSSTSRVSRSAAQSAVRDRAATTAPVRRGGARPHASPAAPAPTKGANESPEASPQLTGELMASGMSQASAASPLVEAGSQQPLLSKPEQLSQLLSGPVAARTSEEGLAGDGRPPRRKASSRSNVYTPGATPPLPLQHAVPSYGCHLDPSQALLFVCWYMHVPHMHEGDMCRVAADTASLHVSGGRRRAAKAAGTTTTDSSASSIRSTTRQGMSRAAGGGDTGEGNSTAHRGRSGRGLKIRTRKAADSAALAATSGETATENDCDSPRVKFVCCMSPLCMPRRMKGWTTPSEDASLCSVPR